MAPISTVGLDVGGANLKLAHDNGIARCDPFALWQFPDSLGTRLDSLLAAMPGFDRIALTMTGELCDCYASRRDGVRHITECVQQCAGGRAVVVWSLRGRFVTPEDARANPAQCAAANWHALATWVSQQYPVGLNLMLDVGSTTTDVIPLKNGEVVARGRDDTDRLATGELVYLGGERTPCMALGPEVTWRGRRYALMAEHFATIQDVFLLAGHGPEQPRRMSACDGQPLTVTASARRLLRMIGADLEALSVDDAKSLARCFASRWMGRIADAIGRVTAGRSCSQIIISGSGDRLGAMAAGLALPEVTQVMLRDAIGPTASEAAVAWGLVALAATRHDQAAPAVRDLDGSPISDTRQQ